MKLKRAKLDADSHTELAYQLLSIMVKINTLQVATEMGEEPWRPSDVADACSKLMQNVIAAIECLPSTDDELRSLNSQVMDDLGIAQRN
ncbi:MAG: hypothetical protein RLP16_05530 [Alphaproteobacteria bacterium]